MKRFAVAMLALIIAMLVPVSALAAVSDCCCVTFLYGDKVANVSVGYGYSVNELAVYDITQYMNPDDGCVNIIGWTRTPYGLEFWAPTQAPVKSDYTLYPILEYTPKGLTELIARYEYMDFDGTMLPEFTVTKSERDEYNGDYIVTVGEDSNVRIRFRKDVVKRIYMGDTIYYLLDDPYEGEEPEVPGDYSIGPKLPIAEDETPEDKGDGVIKEYDDGVTIEKDDGEEVVVVEDVEEEENQEVIYIDEIGDDLDEEEIVDDTERPNEEETLDEDKHLGEEDFLDEVELAEDEALLNDEEFPAEVCLPAAEEQLNEESVLDDASPDNGHPEDIEPDEDPETVQKVSHNNAQDKPAPEKTEEKSPLKEEKPEPKAEQPAGRESTAEAPKASMKAADAVKSVQSAAGTPTVKASEAVKAASTEEKVPETEKAHSKALSVPGKEPTAAAAVKNVPTATRAGTAIVITVSVVAIAALFAIMAKRTRN